MNMGKKSFWGRGWSFPPEFEQGKTVTQMVKDEEDIRQSLRILFSTSIGERFNRQYGCNLNDFVHEVMNPTILRVMEERIRQAVILYEPRIDLEKVIFDLSHEMEGMLVIELVYYIRQLNVESNLVYPFYLEN